MNKITKSILCLQVLLSVAYAIDETTTVTTTFTSTFTTTFTSTFPDQKKDRFVQSFLIGLFSAGGIILICYSFDYYYKNKILYSGRRINPETNRIRSARRFTLEMFFNRESNIVRETNIDCSSQDITEDVIISIEPERYIDYPPPDREEYYVDFTSNGEVPPDYMAVSPPETTTVSPPEYGDVSPPEYTTTLSPHNAIGLYMEVHL